LRKIKAKVSKLHKGFNSFVNI